MFAVAYLDIHKKEQINKSISTNLNAQKVRLDG